MEIRKIALACFIGGVLCCTVALMFAPTFWWLGLLAGIAAGVVSGYVSYDFREVLRKIPIALRAAGKSGAKVWNTIVHIVLEVRKWLREPHPVFYSSLGFSIAFFLWIDLSYIDDVAAAFGTRGEMISSADYNSGYFFLFLISAIVLEVTGFLLFPLFITIGAHSEHLFWDSLMAKSLWRREDEYSEKAQMTYRNTARWLVKGLGIVILFLVAIMWWKLAVGIARAIYFLVRLALHLIRLTYSRQRILCAVNGTLGGIASFVWLAPSAKTLSEQILLVLFGGILGVAFGVANWEIVSKRILHVNVRAPVNSGPA